MVKNICVDQAIERALLKLEESLPDLYFELVSATTACLLLTIAKSEIKVYNERCIDSNKKRIEDLASYLGKKFAFDLWTTSFNSFCHGDETGPFISLDKYRHFRSTVGPSFFSCASFLYPQSVESEAATEVAASMESDFPRGDIDPEVGMSANEGLVLAAGFEMIFGTHNVDVKNRTERILRLATTYASSRKTLFENLGVLTDEQIYLAFGRSLENTTFWNPDALLARDSAVNKKVRRGVARRGVKPIS